MSGVSFMHTVPNFGLTTRSGARRKRGPLPERNATQEVCFQIAQLSHAIGRKNADKIREILQAFPNLLNEGVHHLQRAPQPFGILRKAIETGSAKVISAVLAGVPEPFRHDYVMSALELLYSVTGDTAQDFDAFCDGKISVPSKHWAAVTRALHALIGPAKTRCTAIAEA